MNTSALAQEILDAYANRRTITAPSVREGGFDLGTAFAVESEIVRLRRAAGHSTVGLKVGFANKAMWRVLGIDTVLWGHMYADTVHYAKDNQAWLPVTRMLTPKIEAEIVFKLKRPLAGETEAAAVLDAVESIALGFEIIDCVIADWKMQPADWVASKGLHAGLIVGDPLRVTIENAATLAAQLAGFTVTLSKNGAKLAEGAGKNLLGSPAVCVGEVGLALSKHGAQPLAAGDLVSSGSLTEAPFIAPGEKWTAEVNGLPLPILTLITG